MRPFPRARDEPGGRGAPIPREPWTPHRLTISTAGASPAPPPFRRPRAADAATSTARAAARGWSASSGCDLAELPGRALARPPAAGAAPSSVAPELVLAAEADEEEDQDRGDEPEEEGAPGAGADRQQADPDVRAEDDAPEEGVEPGAERRGAGGTPSRPSLTPAPPETASDQKNSPSRFRFRPPLRPTFGFRLRPPGGASTYSRSVLGASGNLDGPQGLRKPVAGSVPRNLRKVHFSTFSTGPGPGCGHLCGSRLGA